MGSGMKWSFSNKGSDISPEFVSFQSCQEDNPGKSVNDPLTSSGFLSVSTTNGCDSNHIHKSHSGIIQKNMLLDKQAGNLYTMATYDANHVHHPHEMRMFPLFSNQSSEAITVSRNNFVLQSHIASSGEIVAANVTNPPLGGVPIVPPVSALPITNSTIGTTDLRIASRFNGAPAQLTIFYNGSVFVYDDVSPDKAQAIMLLAGNVSSVNHNRTLPTAQVLASTPRSSLADGCIGNGSRTASPCSGLPSSIPVTSHVGSQSGGGVKSGSDIGAVASCSESESLKAVSSVGSAPNLISAVAVPQARKASLARFLEKRKERVTNTSPYNASKKSRDCNSPGSESISVSVNSSSSSLLPATN